MDSVSSFPRFSTRSALAASTALLALGTATRAHADSKQACGDAFYAVQVLRDEGKLEDALEAANVCVSESCAAFVRDDCAKWKIELESALGARAATVVVEAFDEDGDPIRDARATLGGEPWLASLDGQPRELTPGTHVVEVTLDGEEPQRRSILVRAGDKEQRLAFRFDTRSELSRGDGPLPWVLGGVGLAALVAGTVTGALVIDAYLTTEDECSDATQTCSPEGSDAQDLGRALGPPTTVLLVSGSVLFAAGLIWKLVDSGPRAPVTASLVVAPVVSSNHVGVALGFTN